VTVVSTFLTPVVKFAIGTIKLVFRVHTSAILRGAGLFKLEVL
jgi:hypothetical protein